MDFFSELGEIYNDCRKSQQAAGRKVKPHAFSVSQEFFSWDGDNVRRSRFNDAKHVLEEQLFFAHPMVDKVYKLFDATCSSLSFFRQLEDDSFPIDEDLFHQIQHAQIRYAREVLQSQLIVEARTIFNALPEHEWVEPRILDKFLMCVRKVMSLHLGRLLFKTLHSVVELFKRFESDVDDSAIFILNLIVDEDNRIRYSPEPQQTLIRISGLIELVKDAICSVPVVQSNLSSIPSYNDLMVVSSHEANVMMEQAKSQLADIYSRQMSGPENLLSQFNAYSFVLSEAYYEFLPNWHSNWKKIVPAWGEVWKRSRKLVDEIEVLSKNEEDVGMFVAITSGPEEQKLVTEVLVNKAASLGKHIKDTISDHLNASTQTLLRECEDAHFVCTQRSVEPKELFDLAERQKTVKPRLKRMAAQAEDLVALHEVIMKQSYWMLDSEAFSIFRCSYLVSVLPKLEDEARNFFSEVSCVYTPKF